MFRSIRLQDYGGFEDATVELHPNLTLLVGRNGSGKSTVLDALLMMLCAGLRSTGTLKRGDQPWPEFYPYYPDVRAGSTTLRVTIKGDKQAVAAFRSDGPTPMGPITTPKVDTACRELNSIFFVESGVGNVEYRRTSQLTHTTPESAALLSAFSVPAVRGTVDVQEWFQHIENIENEVRLNGQPDHRNAILSVVRGATESFLSHLSGLPVTNLRVSRVRKDGSPHIQGRSGFLMVEKSGIPMMFHHLSSGEQRVLTLVMDLAYRLSIWHGTENALTGKGVFLWDEVAQHLHPGWQRRVLPALMEAFPNLQILATTHSPQVVGSVPAACVRLLHDFQVHDSPPTHGRDTNSLLEEVFDVPERDPTMASELEAIGSLLDADDIDFTAVRQQLQAMRSKLTASDPEVARLQSILEFMES